MTEISKIIYTFQRYPKLFAKYGWVFEDLAEGSNSAALTDSGARMNLLAGQSEGSENTQSLSRANLTEPEPYLYVLMSAGIIDVPAKLGPKQQEEWISLIQGKMTALFGKTVRRQPIRDFLGRADLEGLLARERGPEQTEGVTNERSYRVEKEDKLKGGQLPAIFDGTLDRDAMARALNAVMIENGLSVRKAADAAEVSRTDIERISKGSATLDKSADVLRNLGYELHIEVRKLDEP